jgi:hypothetical protein
MNRTVINKSISNNQTNNSPDIRPEVNRLLGVNFLTSFSSAQNSIGAGMVNIDIQQHILAAIKEVKPKMEQGIIDVDEDIREECNFNTRQFQHYLSALKSSTGVSIAEGDYNQVNTFNKMFGYLSEKLSI